MNIRFDLGRPPDIINQDENFKQDGTMDALADILEYIAFGIGLVVLAPKQKS